MPKPLKPRTVALLVAMVAALCAAVVVAYCWRPLMAQCYCIKLRSDDKFAREALGLDLGGWRDDGVSAYLQTEHGGRVLCEELLREIRALPTQPTPAPVGYVGADQDWIYFYKEYGLPTVLIRISDYHKGARLKKLFGHTIRVHPGISAIDDVTATVLTVSPESVSDAIQMWCPVQITKINADKGEN